MSEFDWLDEEFAETGDGSFDWLADDYELVTTRQLSSPKIHAKRTAKRQFIAGLKKEALNTLIPTLPPPDVDLYVISNGAGAEIRHGVNPLAFDFGSFLPHVVRMLGDGQCTAYVSTWTAARTHTLTMLEMLKDERLKALTFCSDPYFARREAAIYTEFVTGLDRYPGRARYLGFKNHCKIIAVANADESAFCSISGSANLSAQPRCEQYVLTTAPDAYSFFVTEFFEAMFERSANGKR